MGDLQWVSHRGSAGYRALRTLWSSSLQALRCWLLLLRVSERVLIVSDGAGIRCTLLAESSSSTDRSVALRRILRVVLCDAEPVHDLLRCPDRVSHRDDLADALIIRVYIRNRSRGIYLERIDVIGLVLDLTH